MNFEKKYKSQSEPIQYNIDSIEKPDKHRNVVLIGTYETYLTKYKMEFIHYNRLFKNDKFVYIWVYFDEIREHIFNIKSNFILQMSIHIHFPGDTFTHYVWNSPYGPHTSINELIPILEKAFFWQSWIGGPYHLKFDPYNRNPIKMELYFGRLDETSKSAIDAYYDPKYIPQEYLLMLTKRLLLSNYPSNFRNTIIEYKKNGLIYNENQWKFFGIEIKTIQVSDSEKKHLIYVDDNPIPEDDSNILIKWIRNVVRYTVDDASSPYYINYDNKLVDGFTALRPPKILDFDPFYIWKVGEYKEINEAAFTKVGSADIMTDVFELDKKIRTGKWPKYDKPFNVFRAFWPVDESDKMIQRGPNFDDLIPGQHIHIDGFLATAYTIPPSNFLGSSCCLMIIEVPLSAYGTFAILDNNETSYGGHGTENEVLFAMGTTLVFKERRFMTVHNRSVDVSFFYIEVSEDHKVISKLLNHREFIFSNVYERYDLLFIYSIITKFSNFSKILIEDKKVNPNVYESFGLFILIYDNTLDMVEYMLNQKEVVLSNRMCESILEFFLNTDEDDYINMFKLVLNHPKFVVTPDNAILRAIVGENIRFLKEMLNIDKYTERFDLIISKYEMLHNNMPGYHITKNFIERKYDISNTKERIKEAILDSNVIELENIAKRSIYYFNLDLYLTLAIKTKNEEVVLKLLNLRIPLNNMDKSAILLNENPSMLYQMLKHPDVNEFDVYKMISTTIDEENVKNLQILLSNTDHSKIYGMGYLENAILTNNLKIIEIILMHNITTKDEFKKIHSFIEISAEVNDLITKFS